MRPKKCRLFDLDHLVEMVCKFRAQNEAKMNFELEKSVIECQNVLGEAALKHYLIRS